MKLFENRRIAGKSLAAELTRYRRRSDVVVMALPRGGVPVAYEIAAALEVPLDVMIVRKIGVPGYSELAMGAIASGGIYVANEDVIHSLHISQSAIDEVVARERIELERREHTYRSGRPAQSIRDRVVILVDDGIATGATMRAAVGAIKQQHPAELIIAVPTSAADSSARLQPMVDRFVCLATPEPYYAVGAWYEDFSQTSDNEVRDLLERANRPPSAGLKRQA